MDKLFVLACQAILEVLQHVDQNVPQVVTAHLMKLVVIKNVEILVLELAELMLNAKL
jgi:hypothetical protein